MLHTFLSGGAIGGGARGGRPPDSCFATYGALVDHNFTKYAYIFTHCKNICIFGKIMQTIYIGNSLLGDELAIAQQLISDILTCFEADVLHRAPLAAEAPHR